MQKDVSIYILSCIIFYLSTHHLRNSFVYFHQNYITDCNLYDTYNGHFKIPKFKCMTLRSLKALFICTGCHGNFNIQMLVFKRV